MKVAAIDIGTNSFLCLIAKVDASKKSVQILHDESKVVRLGQDMAKQEKGSKKFHPEALLRAEECLTAFAKTIAKHKVEKCVAVATSAARDSNNTNELEAICQKLSIPLRIISGEQEAEMSYLGACFDLDSENGIGILDIGGGSTEVLYKNQEQKLQGMSIDIGAVRLTEMFLSEKKSSPLEITKLRDYASEQVQKWPSPHNLKTLIAVAGTPTTIAMYKKSLSSYDADKINGCVLKIDYLHQLLMQWSPMSVEERKKIKFLDPARADIILAGLAILIESLMHFQLQECFVSTKGLRFGAALSLAENKL